MKGCIGGSSISPCRSANGLKRNRVALVPLTLLDLPDQRMLGNSDNMKVEVITYPRGPCLLVTLPVLALVDYDTGTDSGPDYTKCAGPGNDPGLRVWYDGRVYARDL